MFQVLLVSNLLLWENVYSMPMCFDMEGYNEITIEELFDSAIFMAQYISNLTTQMSEEFVSTSFPSGFFSNEPFRNSTD
jgi:prolactin